MSCNIAIKVDNLSKSFEMYERPVDRLKQLFWGKYKSYYTEFKALDNVSFEVKKGETIGIIGKNGSGKSTLLQLICGTLDPTAGVMSTSGRIAALLELGSGFNLEFSGHDNVYLYAKILGLSDSEIKNRYEDILEFADIGDFISQPVKSYSSGMVVRLAFAVIAHVDADILIIDEALAVGDAFFVQKCMRFLRAFMEKGTVLFVSHDTNSILNLCQKAIWLDCGRKKLEGTPKEVTEKYLASLYESEQGESDLVEVDELNSPLEFRDMRLDFINTTTLRNDIEIFPNTLKPNAFGKGGASISDVKLLDENSKTLSWVVGGEKVKIRISCKSSATLSRPIIGFQVKDRLGQVVFADNTYLTYINTPFLVDSKNHFEAEFSFFMPLLPVGDYSINAAIAEGTQEEHVQHHWIFDALLFKVHSTSVCHGLIGVPMSNIKLRK